MEPTKEENYIPDIITDANKGVSFRKGRFYGKVNLYNCEILCSNRFISESTLLFFENCL